MLGRGSSTLRTPSPSKTSERTLIEDDGLSGPHVMAPRAVWGVEMERMESHLFLTSTRRWMAWLLG